MEIRIVTWNIHKAIGMDRRFDLERVVEVVRQHDPDVLLLQEVDRDVPRSRRLWLDHEIAHAAGYPYHTWARNHGLKEGGYGNATLSRLPITRKRNIDLTIGRRKKRSSLFTRLELPGHFRHLHVFNWHLGLSAAERDQQVAKLLYSGTFRSLNRNARVILGGDTNDWRNLLYRGAGLKQAGFDAWAEHGRRRPITTYPAVAPVGPLDKFFWRGPLGDGHVHSSRLKLARVASDHRPLVMEISVLPA